jgi:hypothetical protein
LVLEEEYVSRYLKLYSGEQLIELNESKDEWMNFVFVF